jgi:hypothetical protein
MIREAFEKEPNWSQLANFPAWVPQGTTFGWRPQHWRKVGDPAIPQGQGHSNLSSETCTCLTLANNKKPKLSIRCQKTAIVQIQEDAKF